MNHAGVDLWNDMDVVLAKRTVRGIVEWIMPRKSVKPLSCRSGLVELNGQLRVLLEAGTVRILQQVVHGILGLRGHMPSIDRNAQIDAAHLYSPFSFKQASSTLAVNDYYPCCF